jgi:hypothetical protein
MIDAQASNKLEQVAKFQRSFVFVIISKVWAGTVIVKDSMSRPNWTRYPESRLGKWLSRKYCFNLGGWGCREIPLLKLKPRFANGPRSMVKKFSIGDMHAVISMEENGRDPIVYGSM